MPFPDYWNTSGDYPNVQQQNNTPAVRVHLVQREVFNLVAKRLGVTAMTDIFKLRELFSENDLRMISAFSDFTSYLPDSYKASFKNTLPHTDSLFTWDDAINKNSEGQSFYNRVRYSTTEDTLKCMQYFKTEEDQDKDSEALCCDYSNLLKSDKPEKPYDVVASHGHVFVLLDPVFFKDLDKTQFLKDVVKVLYSQDRINNVNQGPWYGHYVAALKSEVSL